MRWCDLRLEEFYIVLLFMLIIHKTITLELKH